MLCNFDQFIRQAASFDGRCPLMNCDSVAPPGFCNRGGSEVWVYRGSRVRSPTVPVALSVNQRCSLLDGLAMYLSCDTKKFHDNESTHILHNFWTSSHRGKLPSFPPGCATAVIGLGNRQST